jgi:hypothetical protein
VHKLTIATRAIYNPRLKEFAEHVTRPARPKRPRTTRGLADPPPSPLIRFSEPPPAADDHVVRIVYDDRPDWPAPRAPRTAGQPRRWGFYPSHAIAGDEVPDDVEYRFNTVEAATTGALQYLEPYWNDGSPLVIHNGVRVQGMPANAVVTGSPGYRARIDAGLYDMGLERLQAVHLQTKSQIDANARQTAANHEIPLGQLIHAFCLVWEKLPKASRPKMHDWLDQVMPRITKRKRQRHLRAFLIVSSEDWPSILRTTEVAITGMESILQAARIYSKPTTPPRKKKTPTGQRYLALRKAVIRRDLVEAQQLVAQYDREDLDGGDDDDEPE